MDDQNNTQNNLPDDNVQKDETDDTLNIQPSAASSPEGGIIYLNNSEAQPQSENKQETAPEAEPPSEVLHAPETATVPETPKYVPAQDQPVEEQENSPSPAPAADTQPTNIVDMRTGHEDLHNVGETADDFTKKIDEDEKRFIKEVEKHHEHK